MMNQADKRYLEAIYIISMRHEHTRAVDIAKKVKVTRASVSRAIKRLEEQKLICVENKSITLTKIGLEKARKVYYKQVLLEHFFAKVINVSEEVAQKDAEGIKHYISDEVCLNIQKFLLDW